MNNEGKTMNIQEKIMDIQGKQTMYVQGKTMHVQRKTMSTNGRIILYPPDNNVFFIGPSGKTPFPDDAPIKKDVAR